MHIQRLNHGYAKGRVRPTIEQIRQAREIAFLASLDDRADLADGESGVHCGADSGFETIDLHGRYLNALPLAAGIVADMGCRRPVLSRS